MTDIPHSPAANRLIASAEAGGGLSLDTTAGSLVHRLADALCPEGFDGAAAVVKICVAAAAVTYGPLLLAASLGPLPLLTATLPHRLALLHDWNVQFMLLVSFPCLVWLLVTGQPLLVQSLRSVLADGTITLLPADLERLMSRWRDIFRRTNLWGQVAGLAIGVVIAAFNVLAYTPPSVGFWIADQGHLIPAGYVFLYCITLFYAVIALYVFRNFATALLLRDIVAHAELHMLPFHPDRAGGLRPVGRLGLRNQYGLTLLGLNVVLLVLISRPLGISQSLTGLIIAAVVAYLMLGPLVFVAPLLPFRGGMLRNKSELMREVALRIRVELDRLRKQLASGPIAAEDEELIERLRKIGAVINELPVWPFDATTLRKFLTAYAIPVASSAAIPLAKLLLYLLSGHAANLTIAD